MLIPTPRFRNFLIDKMHLEDKILQFFLNSLEYELSVITLLNVS